MTLDLTTVRFGVGYHRQPLTGTPTGDRDMCIMEAVAFMAGERWTDRPACASPIISAFIRCWQDTLLNADRDRLLPASVWVPRLMGSAADEKVEQRRVYLLWDWLTREYTPAWLSMVPGLAHHADTLRRLSPIVDEPSRVAVIETVRDVDLAVNWKRSYSWDVWTLLGYTGGKSARTALYTQATGGDPLLLLDMLRFIQTAPVSDLLNRVPTHTLDEFSDRVLVLLDRLLLVK